MLAHQIHGDAPGTPLLIAHGLFGSGRNWGVIAKRLSDTRRVVTVDMRNHGKSPWHPTHSYPDLATDLAEVISHLGGPMHVLGHSMGGKAAMVLALTQPQAIARLIIGDIAPVTYTHSQLPAIEAMRAVDLSALTRRSEAAAQLGQFGIDPSLQSFFTQSLDVPGRRWRFNFDALTSEMPKIMSFPDLTAQHAGPTLFLSGASSDYVTRDHRDVIRGYFPTARFARIPDAGHWLHAENPRAFEAAVRTYLDAPTP